MHIACEVEIKKTGFELQDTNLQPVIEQCFDWLIGCNIN